MIVNDHPSRTTTRQGREASITAICTLSELLGVSRQRSRELKQKLEKRLAWALAACASMSLPLASPMQYTWGTGLPDLSSTLLERNMIHWTIDWEKFVSAFGPTCPAPVTMDS